MAGLKVRRRGHDPEILGDRSNRTAQGAGLLDVEPLGDQHGSDADPFGVLRFCCAVPWRGRVAGQGVEAQLWHPVGRRLEVHVLRLLEC